MTETIPLDRLIVEHRFQGRVGLNPQTVEEYAQAYRDGAEMPPIEVVLVDDIGFIVVDGFHRVEAAKQAGLIDIAFDMTYGETSCAFTACLEANVTHGERLTKADNMRRVGLLLEDEPLRTALESNEERAHFLSIPLRTYMRYSEKWRNEPSDDPEVQALKDAAKERAAVHGASGTFEDGSKDGLTHSDPRGMPPTGADQKPVQPQSEMPDTGNGAQEPKGDGLDHAERIYSDALAEAVETINMLALDPKYAVENLADSLDFHAINRAAEYLGDLMDKYETKNPPRRSITLNT